MKLDRMLPGFAEYVQSEENLFGTETLCSVFAACSHFVRERTVTVDCWKQMATLLNQATGSSDQQLAEAACTCFIENLAESGHPMRAFLEGAALRYWKAWEAAG